MNQNTPRVTYRAHYESMTLLNPVGPTCAAP